MDDVTLVGIDLGKHTFHLHGQDAKGKAVFRKKMRRKQPIEFFATFHACTVVMEACAGSHHMARKLAAIGHTVKLISPRFGSPSSSQTRMMSARLRQASKQRHAR